jgi:hypothetical protein
MPQLTPPRSTPAWLPRAGPGRRRAVYVELLNANRRAIATEQTLERQVKAAPPQSQVGHSTLASVVERLSAASSKPELIAAENGIPGVRADPIAVAPATCARAISRPLLYVVSSQPFRLPAPPEAELPTAPNRADEAWPLG